jgi:type VI secretion system protein ImpG
MAHLPHTDVAGLLSSAEEFVQALPVLASALAAPSSDAPLERAREGIFYLAATVMDQTREFERDGQRALAEVVAPDVLRPRPAATVVELASERPVARVPAGAEIHTQGPSHCRFRTASDTRVGPWKAEQARIEHRGGGDVLSFDVVSTNGLHLGDAIGARARFYVDAGRESALSLVAHLLAHTERAELAVDGREVAELTSIQPYGMRPEQALFPEPDGPYTGLSLLREYFLLPEKFCFFELGGFTPALRGTATRRATVTLLLRKGLPANISIAPGAVRAHCVPAVNLFRATSEPWVFGPGRTSAPVRVAGLSRDDGGVYAVLKASALARGTEASSPMLLCAVRRFAAGTLRPEFPYAFSSKLVARPDSGEPELVLCLTSPRRHVPKLAPHVVSLELLATNRTRGGAVRPGELTEPGPGMPPGVRARNVLACSPYVPPPAPAELALQVAVRAAVADGDASFSLRSQLAALVPRRGVDSGIVRAHHARVAAIGRVEIGLAIDRARGRRGYDVQLGVDETPFQGAGDVALFVRLLHGALEAQASLGAYYVCRATCAKSGAQVVWPPEQP